MNFESENRHPVTAKFFYKNQECDLKLQVSCLTYPELDLLDKAYNRVDATKEDNYDVLCNVVLGWEDVTMDGEPVVYSREVFKQYLGTYIGLSDAVYTAIVGEAMEIRKKNLLNSDFVGLVQAAKSQQNKKKSQKKSEEVSPQPL